MIRIAPHQFFQLLAGRHPLPHGKPFLHVREVLVKIQRLNRDVSRSDVRRRARYKSMLGKRSRTNAIEFA